MSYTATFKPTKEFMEDFEKKSFILKNEKEYENETKVELLCYCMRDWDEKETFKKVYDHIKFSLSYLNNVVKSDVRKWVANEYKEKGEVYFNGWNYAKDECDFDYDDIFLSTLKNLVLLKQVQTPNYFDDIDKHYDKRNGIERELDGFVECCAEIANFEIMNEMKEFRVNDDYDDYYYNKSEDDCDKTSGCVYIDKNNNEGEQH